MGSKRLPKKNLQEIDSVPLLARAIRKARESAAFSEIWVSSESDVLGQIATNEGAFFHRRREELASDNATSEDFVEDFLRAVDCEWVVQLHSIAPLITLTEIRDFVSFACSGEFDSVFSFTSTRLEAVYEGHPLNFSYDRKTNSQELEGVREISWSITAWRKETFLFALEKGECGTYSGRKGWFELSKLSGHVIKTALDLEIARMLSPLARPGLLRS